MMNGARRAPSVGSSSQSIQEHGEAAALRVPQNSPIRLAGSKSGSMRTWGQAVRII
jgi:hypothetical protein